MKIDKMLLGVLLGNFMEFYDFTIYAFFSKQISLNFFPNEDYFIAIILTLVVFAIGYLTRPLGALFFGYIGDKYGRKCSLTISIFLITFATFLMGVIPNYEAIGILAPLFLLFLRLLQGFSVSGEEGGAVVYLSENRNFKSLGFLGSLILASVFLGVLIASFFV